MAKRKKVGRATAQLSGEEVVATVRRHQSKTLLSFSRGKDAIAAWLAIRDAFDEVIPFHLTLVPGLEFVEESLQDFERFFGVRIIRMTHPSLYRWLNGMTFQPPERCEVIEQAGLPDFDYTDVRECIVKHLGLQDDILYATGVRSADSPMRRMAISMYGAITWAQHKYHPVHDWNKQRVIDEFRRHKIVLPVDYELFGRTLDGLDLRFLWPIKQRFPRDYQRILEWFPLADLEVFRYECALNGK